MRIDACAGVVCGSKPIGSASVPILSVFAFSAKYAHCDSAITTAINRLGIFHLVASLSILLIHVLHVIYYRLVYAQGTSSVGFVLCVSKTNGL